MHDSGEFPGITSQENCYKILKYLEWKCYD